MRCPQCSKMMPQDQRFCGSCGTPLTMTSPGHDALDRLGEILNGRYRLTKLIGLGGNGAVYQAEVVGLGHSVAVKVLHADLLSDPTARRRIENEARLASQIDHPNTVSILDYLSSPKLTYLVMEYLTGISLAEVLFEDRFLGVKRTIHVARQVLRALEASHRVGVLHRDLKPDNIYIVARQDELDFVKVLDFGMATIAHLPQEARITAANRIVGTPAYMAPEQIRNRELTERTDLYAVGVLLYECLTGVNPFLTNSVSDTMVNHVTLEPRAPSKLCKEAKIPPYLDAIVMQALRKEPSERFESAATFRRVLEGLVLTMQQIPEQHKSEERLVCSECGKVNSTGATRCDGCDTPFATATPFDRSELAPEMIHALDASSSDLQEEYDLAPVTTTIAKERPFTWEPTIVGRQREIEELDQFLEFGPPPYAQRFLRIVGAAGTGKSRLARHVFGRATKEWKKIRVKPEILPVFASLYPIQKVAAQLLNLLLPVDDSVRLLDAAAKLGVSMKHRAGLLELFGMSEDAQGAADPRRAVRAAAFKAIVRAANAKCPLLLAFQDMHVYDAPSAELVAGLIDGEPCDNPLVIVATHDPKLVILWGECHTMALGNLDRQSALSLARNALQPLGLNLDQIGGPSEVEQLVVRSNGNPFALIELLRLRANTSVIDSSLTGIAGVISQRIAHLPPHPRMMLHTMAILGRPASSETLVAMVSDMQKDYSALRFLVGMGFLIEEKEGWSFAHRLHREIAYVSTPAGIRQELHHKAADFAIEEEQPSSFIAHHLFEASDYEAAVPYILRAGKRALLALDDTLARELFTRALKVIPDPPNEFSGSRKVWLNAVLGLAISLHDGGDTVGANRYLRRSASLAHQANWQQESESCIRQAEILKG